MSMRNFSWKLKVDQDEIDCELQERPTVHIAEIPQLDGTFLIGKPEWQPLLLTINDCYKPWSGEKNVSLIMYENGTQLEKWTLEDTAIKPAFGGNRINLSFKAVQYENLCN